MSSPATPDHAGSALGMLRRNWGWFFALGLMLFIFGLAALFLPLLFGELFVIIVGWAFLIGGIMEIGHAIWRRGWSGFWIELVSGLLSTVVGSLILLHPGASLMTITLMIGVVFLVGGIFRFAIAVAVKNPYGAWIVLHGLIGMLLGLMILFGWPQSSIWVIGTLVGIDMVFNGCRLMSLGLAARRSAAHLAHAA